MKGYAVYCAVIHKIDLYKIHIYKRGAPKRNYVNKTYTKYTDFYETQHKKNDTKKI